MSERSFVARVFLVGILLAVSACATTPPGPTPGPQAPAVPTGKAPAPRVVVLATGGTIAGTAATATTTVGYKVAALPVQALLEAVPELAQVAEVRGEQVFQIASENMTSAHWLTLSRRVNELLARDDTDGVVITHGTDTLEETAYFLNLTVTSDKPVVLVGAMRPSTALSADGPMNLFNAVALAGSREARSQGVLVCLNDQIHGARDVRKTNTLALDTFRAPELGQLGVMVAGKPVFYRSSTRRHTTRSELTVGGVDTLPRVEVVFAQADATRTAIDAFLAAGVAGLVYAGTGNGSVALAVRPALKEAREKGVVVVRSSRVGTGVVARNGEVDDDAYDLVSGDNLTPQKARILLMLALARTHDTGQIQRIFDEY